MQSIRQQLVFEIIGNAPNLTPEEITENIAHIIEKEILPNAINNLNLPTLPSPVTLKHEELMQKRLGNRQHSLLADKVKLIQDLEKLRTKWNGSGVTDEGISSYNELSDETVVRHPKNDWDIRPIRKKILPEHSEPDRDTLPSSPITEPQEKPRKIKFIEFDNEIRKKIVMNPQFEKLMSTIETKFRESFNQERLSFTFSIKTDSYFPSRERTMINISTLTDDFEENMKLWDAVEDELQKVIDNSPVTEEVRKKINRNIFTNIETK
ncbi:MAG: hypothetical protein NUK62_08955 [Tenericutes bacterium]|nr:hypothetical protein [Mycoplasmatota bacterium]